MELIERTLRECRRRGWYAPKEAVTEVMTIHRKRRDFLGVIDLVVFELFSFSIPHAKAPMADKEYQCVGIQVTSSSNHAARVKKALTNPHLPYWLMAGNRFQVWSWRKKGSRWLLREEGLILPVVDGELCVTRRPASPPQSEPPAER
jgi:hypothetical protein